ncbi:MAG: hypothetical protein Q8K78_08045 [Planctomycetaceae bacterium]|nr:hypothetical protein [Planctomycetaceae bacterium]
MSSPVGFLVCLGDASERIDREPFGLHTPTTEAPHSLQIAIAGSRRHTVVETSRQPAFDRFAMNVAQRVTVAVPEELVGQTLSVGNMPCGSPFGTEMVEVRGKVISNRRRLVIGGRGFTRRDDFAFDKFGSTFQFSKNRTGGILIAAAG